MNKYLLFFLFCFIVHVSNGQQYLSSNQITGTGGAEVESFISDEAQNTYISGYFSGQLVHNNQLETAVKGNDIFLTKYTDDQEESWFVTIGGVGTEQSSRLAFADDGNILIAGVYGEGDCIFGNASGEPELLTQPAGSGAQNIFLAKYSSQTGELLWVKNILAGPGLQNVFSIAIDADGNVLLGGRTASDALFVTSTTNASLGANSGFLAKLSSDGIYSWHVTYFTSLTRASLVSSIVTANNDSVIFAGYTYQTMTFTDRKGDTYTTGPNLSNNTLQYFFIGSVDKDGNYGWLKNSTSSQTSTIQTIAMGSHDDLYVTGLFASGDLAYDGHPLNLAHPGVDGRSAIFLLSLNSSNGNLIEAYSEGSPSNDNVYALQVQNNLLYVAGLLGAQVALPDGRIIPPGMFVAAYEINQDQTLTNIDILEGVAADNAKGLVFSPKSFKLTGSFKSASLAIGDSLYTNPGYNSTTPSSSTSDVYMAKACPIISVKGTVGNVTGCDAKAINGSIQLNVLGGAGPYTYIWSGSNGVIDSLSTDKAMHLPAGNYSVLVSYNDGYCSKTGNFTVALPSDAMAITGIDVEEATCGSFTSKGKITVNGVFPQGVTMEYKALLTAHGTEPYFVDWTTNKEFIDCPPGIYEISIRRADNPTGCVVSAETSVSRIGGTLIPDVGSYTCNIENTKDTVGYIHVEAGGGQNWFGLVDANTGATVITQFLDAASYTFEKVLPGQYKVKAGIVDTETVPGCMVVTNVIEVTQPNAIVISSAKPTGVLCADTPTGKITVMASGGDDGSGGLGILSYAVYKDGSSDAITNYTIDSRGAAIFSNLYGGTYRLVVSDQIACGAVLNNIVVTNDNPALEFTQVTPQDICAGSQPNTGKLTLKATGGAQSGAIYTYTLTGGNTTAHTQTKVSTGIVTYEKLAIAANYHAKVVEQTTKCSFTYPETITIREDDLAVAVVATDAIVSTTSGTLTATASGGTTSDKYQFQLIANEASGFTAYTNPHVYSNLASGTYVVQIRDDIGCIVSQQIDIKSVTGIGDMEKGILKLYPNPTDGRFTIQWDTQTNIQVTVEIYSLSGKLIYKSVAQTGLGGTQSVIDISNQAKGTYILRVAELGIAQKVIVQ